LNERAAFLITLPSKKDYLSTKLQIRSKQNMLCELLLVPVSVDKNGMFERFKEQSGIEVALNKFTLDTTALACFKTFQASLSISFAF